MTENVFINMDRQTTPSEAFLLFHIERGKEVVLRVKGSSMGLTLAPSRDVLVRPLRRSPFFGEVVLLYNGSNFIVHRVVGWVPGKRGLIITKGDNCRHSDPPVRRSEIVGLVIGIQGPEGLCVPWRWRFPLSYLIALVSLTEAIYWRARAKWNRYKRKKS